MYINFKNCTNILKKFKQFSFFFQWREGGGVFRYLRLYILLFTDTDTGIENATAGT